MRGGFSQFMNEATKAAAEAEANRGESTLLIDIDKLMPNPNNKYRINDVEQLAGMIAANDFHLEPLEVMKHEDGYMIIAGHRRMAAWRKLLEDGETKERRLPCIVSSFSDVRVVYEDGDGQQQEEVISADRKAIVRLILSNLGQRKNKTLEEEVWEIEQLEPYARILFKENKVKGTFKEFFAREILQISPSKLMRKRSLERLTDEAKKALYEDHLINESVAIEISSLAPEDQDEYIRAVRDGEVDSNVMDVRQKKRDMSAAEEEEADDDDEPEASLGMDTDSLNVPENEEAWEPPVRKKADAAPSSREDNPVHESTKDGKDKAEETARREKPERNYIPIPKEIGDPHKEANNWFLKSLEDILEMAKVHQQECEAQGDEIGETQWGVRWAVARQKIAEFKAGLTT